MKAVKAKTVKTEMASVEMVNLPEPKKTTAKAVASKVDTKVFRHDVANSASSTLVKPTKIPAEKVASK